MVKKIVIGMSMAMFVLCMPMVSWAGTDENGCEWGIPDEPIYAGDNSHGAGSGSSSGSSESGTKTSGGVDTPSASINQNTSGSNSGSSSYDNTTPGSTTEKYSPGSSTTEKSTTPGSNSSSSSGDSGSNTSGNSNSSTNASGSDNTSNGNSKEDGKGTANKDSSGSSNTPNDGKGTANKDSSGSSSTPDDGKDTANKSVENGGNNNSNKEGNGSTPNGNSIPGDNVVSESNNSSEYTSSINHMYNQSKDNDNYLSEDGNVDWSKVPGTIIEVTVSKDGELYISVVDSTGGIYKWNWNEYWDQQFTQTVKDKDGNEITKTTSLSMKEGVKEEWTYMHTAWIMMNVNNYESKYYGSFTKVAQTYESYTELWPDVDGHYRIIGTPWFHVRYYKIVEVCEDVGNGSTNCWDKDITVSEDTLSRAPSEYTVDVPLICLGCPVPVMCINGACDSSKKLNAVSDDAHKPQMDIKEWSKLEK